jgi:membrane protease YdiL (CAAX protease family)
VTTRGQPPVADPVRSACPDTPVPVARALPRYRQRLTALVEVVLCSGYPTQLLLIGVLAVLGLAAIDESGTLSLSYIFVLSMADTVLMLWLLFYFLRRHQEHPAEVFLGARPRRREFRLGLVLTPVVLGVALGSVSLLHYLWPALRNVPENPFEALLGSPLNAALFAVVAVVAGGVREELQRAFVLRRFEQHLGGGAMGLVVFSLAFGLGHSLQGWDAAVVTGLLGAIWGAVYLVRRSVVSTIVSHAGFNLVEIGLAFASLSTRTG